MLYCEVLHYSCIMCVYPVCLFMPTLEQLNTLNIYFFFHLQNQLCSYSNGRYVVTQVKLCPWKTFVLYDSVRVELKGVYYILFPLIPAGAA